MKTTYSRTWKASKQPRKQRKYQHNAPLHVKAKQINATLHKDLRKKYTIRTIRLREGDKVKILRGQYKGQEGKIEEVNIKRGRIFITKVERAKKDGSKSKVPIHPSNVQVLDLQLEDKKRVERLSKKKKQEIKNE